ncbi:hypothetical protein PybrP1_009177 [[Pythium] brassicae (nom. inval.)]|nr:hypothetical protein PybrP1_009177 [[Pythium] brassicae (nom. inval.)]
MSDLRDAEAALAELEERLALLLAAPDDDDAANNGDDVVFARESALVVVQEAMGGATLELMTRLRARLAMVDSVTQRPRFGPKTSERVQALLQRYDAARDAMGNDAGLAARVGQQAALRRQLAIERARSTELANAQARQALEAQKLREADEKRRQRDLAEQEAQQRVAALAALAQEKREQRAREKLAEERRAQAQRERDAQRTAAFPVGTVGLERAIALLRESTGSAVTPENAAFRRIPRANANFHRDLGRFKGGHECLFALGFQEQAESEEQDDAAVVFVLEEPDLSADLDAWSAWFDNLRAMSAFIEGKLH